MTDCIQPSGLWSLQSAIGAFLGLALHLAMSWQEWGKLQKIKISFRQFIENDAPSVTVACVLAAISYFCVPLLAELKWFQDVFGFTPGVNVGSAALIAFISSTLGYKLRNIVRRRAGVPELLDVP